MRMIAVAALLLAQVAGAAEPAANIPAQLRSCVAIKRNTERLACFDRGIRVLSETQGAQTGGAAPSAESSFGLFAQAPTAPQGDARDEVETLEARVTQIATSADGSALIVLDNDQSWRQISGSATLLLKVGDAVVIRRAALDRFSSRHPTADPRK